MSIARTKVTDYGFGIQEALRARRSSGDGGGGGGSQAYISHYICSNMGEIVTADHDTKLTNELNLLVQEGHLVIAEDNFFVFRNPAGFYPSSESPDPSSESPDRETPTTATIRPANHLPRAVASPSLPVQEVAPELQPEEGVGNSWMESLPVQELATELQPEEGDQNSWVERPAGFYQSSRILVPTAATIRPANYLPRVVASPSLPVQEVAPELQPEGGDQNYLPDHSVSPYGAVEHPSTQIQRLPEKKEAAVGKGVLRAPTETVPAIAQKSYFPQNPDPRGPTMFRFFTIRPAGYPCPVVADPYPPVQVMTTSPQPQVAEEGDEYFRFGDWIPQSGEVEHPPLKTPSPLKEKENPVKKGIPLATKHMVPAEEDKSCIPITHNPRRPTIATIRPAGSPCLVVAEPYTPVQVMTPQRQGDDNRCKGGIGSGKKLTSARRVLFGGDDHSDDPIPLPLRVDSVEHSPLQMQKHLKEKEETVKKSIPISTMDKVPAAEENGLRSIMSGQEPAFGRITDDDEISDHAIVERQKRIDNKATAVEVITNDDDDDDSNEEGGGDTEDNREGGQEAGSTI